jgi:hypothetical protein
MKKIFLIAISCFIAHISPAQLNTTLVVMAQPQGTLFNWGTKEVTYIISNQGGSVVRNAVIKATLKTTDGTVAAATNLAKAKVRTIGPGTLILYAADVMPLDIMVFNGKFKTSLDKSGKLPADNYQLCVQLVTATDFIPVSEERCRNFTLASFQLPIPLMPANETILDIEKAQSIITFRWTPVTPRPAEPVTYRVTVFEIFSDQTPMQALRSNKPLVVKDIVGTTQFIWQPQLGLTKCCYDIFLEADTDGDAGMKKDSGNINHGDPDFDLDAYAFIWTIQTLDSRGAPFGDGNINGDGISEPNVFFIDRRPPAMRRTAPPSRTLYLNNPKGKRN